MERLLHLYQPVRNMFGLNRVRTLLDSGAELRHARLIHCG
jgi:hypothetical protein